MQYFARTRDGKTFVSESDSQLLHEHLSNVSQYAKSYCAKFGAASVGEMLGLLHDYGKFNPAFQDKMINNKKIKVPHAPAGAKLLYDSKDLFTQFCGMLIAGHHGGLGDSGDVPELSNYAHYGDTKDDLQWEADCAFDTSVISTSTHKRLNATNNKQQQSFCLWVYLKMLFSALVDADHTDAEEFCTGVKREPACSSISMLADKLQKNLPVSNNDFINEVRAHILKDCLAAAKQPQGMFSLTVPAGGGKTISSLAFALEHAREHNLARVIYVIPYTSIIEQNARVISELIGSEHVLEHHSNILPDRDDFTARWAMENWDLPVVVTTNVQFFESFFSNRPARSRKLHNVANSVVIFDEAQILPAKYLSPSLYLLSELVVNYGVTTVLCSATQPEIEKYKYDNIKVNEIAGNQAELARQLKRVRYNNIGKKTDEELAELLLAEQSALLVVNSRKHAFSLYTMLEKNLGEKVVCLSTLIPPYLRRKKIEHIKEKLAAQEPVLVVSTQLIEAGVDIDFPAVYRSAAGIDSIIQAGGRANREGKLPYGQVYVFEPVSENGKTPRSLQTTVNLGRLVIADLGDEAFELAGIKKYFEQLYSTKSENGLLDDKKILAEFELDAKKINFKTVADKYKIIEENSYSIIIPLTESARELIVKLRTNEFSKETVRFLSQYSVSVYEQEFVKLNADAVIESINGFYILNNINYYREATGLDIFTHDNKNAECYQI